MIVPIDRPIVDARNIAAAATQTISATGFTIQHNNKPVVLITLSGSAQTYTSDATTAIADGVVDGQALVLILKNVDDVNKINIKDNANTVLKGDWYRNADETWLRLSWDQTASQWIETGRDEGGLTTASGLISHAEGGTTTASGIYSHAEGYNTTASGSYSHTEGNGTTASGSYSHTEGNGTTASGSYSHAKGYYSTSRSIEAMSAQASGRFAATGDAQFTRLVLRRQVAHSNSVATWYSLYIDGATATKLFTIPANSVANFRVMVVGKRDDDTKRFAYNITGCIARNGANSTVILGTPTVTNVYEADDTDYEVQAVADDTNEALDIQVRDTTFAGDTVRWVAAIEAVEVGY